MTTVQFYSKDQVDAKIPESSQLVPATTGASAGDVLTFDGEDVAWTAPAPSGSVRVMTQYFNMTTLVEAMGNAPIGSQLIARKLGRSIHGAEIETLSAFRVDNSIWSAAVDTVQPPGTAGDSELICRAIELAFGPNKTLEDFTVDWVNTTDGTYGTLDGTDFDDHVTSAYLITWQRNL